jgi:hypothetical protein
MWQGYLTAILGVWIAIVPYLNFSSGQETMVLIISGIAFVVLGIWDAMEVRKCDMQS